MKLHYKSAARIIRWIAGFFLYIMLAAVAIIFAVALAGRGSLPEYDIRVVYVFLVFSIKILALYIIADLIDKHLEWGRTLGLIFGVLALGAFPIGTVFGVLIILYLTKGWNRREEEADGDEKPAPRETPRDPGPEPPPLSTREIFTAGNIIQGVAYLGVTIALVAIGRRYCYADVAGARNGVSVLWMVFMGHVAWAAWIVPSRQRDAHDRIGILIRGTGFALIALGYMLWIQSLFAFLLILGIVVAILGRRYWDLATIKRRKP